MDAEQIRAYRAVLRECGRWGVRVVYGEPPTDTGVYTGPMWGSIHWPSRTIYWPPDCPHREGPSALLHELAHCLPGDRPSIVGEIDSGMLYIEWVTARRCKLKCWKTWMHDYLILDEDGRSHRYTEAPQAAKSYALSQSQDGAFFRDLIKGDGKLSYWGLGIRDAHEEHPTPPMAPGSVLAVDVEYDPWP